MGDIRPNDWLLLSPSLVILLAGQAGIIVEAANWWRPSASWSGGEGWMGDWWTWEEMVSWATDQREPLLLTSGWWGRELISRGKNGKMLMVAEHGLVLKNIYLYLFGCTRASQVALVVKNLPAMQETWVWTLGWEDPLQEGMATHSSTLAWRIPWTEEPGRLQSMGSQRVRHDWATKHSTLPNSSPAVGLLSLNLY